MSTAPGSTAANFTALYTIARREVNRILRIWGQTLVPPAITMTLYFLISLSAAAKSQPHAVAPPQRTDVPQAHR